MSRCYPTSFTLTLVMACSLAASEPMTIADLRVDYVTAHGCGLRWTAPAGAGAATAYDVRVISDATKLDDWNAWTPIDGEPLPRSAGTAQGMTVSGLKPNVCYRVAMTAIDGRGTVIARSASLPFYPMTRQKYLGVTWRWPKIEQINPLIGTVFNQITPENAGKWTYLENAQDTYNWLSLDKMSAYAAAHQMMPKQHTFIWGWFKTFGKAGSGPPSWVTNDNAKVQAEELIKLFGQRFPNMAQIEPANEVTHTTVPFAEGLGGTADWAYVVWIFQKTRQYCPMALLQLNDYEVLENDPAMVKHLAVVEVLKRHGLIDGIALQGHFIENQSPADLRRRLDLAAAFGLPLCISEYTANFADDAAQAQAVEAQIRVFMEHPAVHGVTFWGLETRGWRPDAGLVRDGVARPAMAWLKTYRAAQPGVASAPNPADQAQAVARSGLSLSWTCGYAATRRRLYLGTRAQLGAEDLVFEQTALSHAPVELRAGTTYYWRVDEVNDNGLATGPVWSFTTAADR